MVSLNNLTGMNEEEVKAYLDRNELSINQHEEHSDSVEEGLVSSQSPESGTEVEKGSTVDVYLSLELGRRTAAVSLCFFYGSVHIG